MSLYDELGAIGSNNHTPVLGLGVNPATQAIDEPTVNEGLIRQQRIERGDFSHARGRVFSGMTAEEFEANYRAAQVDAAKPRRADGTVIEERSALGRGLSNLYNQTAFGITEDAEHLMAANENQQTKSAALHDYEEQFKKEAGEVYTEKEGFATDWGSQLGDVAMMMIKEPGHASDMLLEQIANSIPSLALSAGGMAAGAAIGAKMGGLAGAATGPAAPVAAPAGALLGTILGGIFGMATGGGVGSGLTEYAAEKVQQVTQRVKDPTNIDEVVAAINDPKIMSDSERAAFLKAEGVGVTDFVTSLMTGGLSRIPGMSKVAKVALGSTVELAGEPIGEYAGQALQKSEGFRDEIDYADVVMEGALGGGQSIVQAAIANSTKFGVAATEPMRAAQQISVEQKIQKVREDSKVNSFNKDNPFKNDYTKVQNNVGAAREQAAQKDLPADEQREVGEVLFSDTAVAEKSHIMNKYADHFGTRGLGNKYVQDSFNDLVDIVLAPGSSATSKQEARDAIDGFMGTVKGYTKKTPLYREGATASDLKAIGDEAVAPYLTALDMQERYEARIAEEKARKHSIAETKAEVAKGQLAAKAAGKETGTKPAPEPKREVVAKTVVKVKGKEAADQVTKTLGPTAVVEDKGNGNFEVTKERLSDDPPMSDTEVAAEIKSEAAVANQAGNTLTVEENIPEEVVEDEVVGQIEDFAPVDENGPAAEPARDAEVPGTARPSTAMEATPAEAQTTEAVPAVTGIEGPTPTVTAEPTAQSGLEAKMGAIEDAEGRIEQVEGSIAQFKSREVQDISVQLAIDSREKELAQAKADLADAKGIEVDNTLTEEFIASVPEAPQTTAEPAQEQTDTNVAPEVQETAKEAPAASPARQGTANKATAEEAAQIAPVKGEAQVTPADNLAKFEKLHDKFVNARESKDMQKAMAAFAKAKDHANTWFPELNLQTLKDYDNFVAAVMFQDAKQFNRPDGQKPGAAKPEEAVVDNSDVFETEVVYDEPTESGDVQEEVTKTTAEDDASFVAQLNQNPPIRVDSTGIPLETDEAEYSSGNPLVIVADGETQVFWNGSYRPVNELELGAREQILKDITLFGDNFDIDGGVADLSGVEAVDADFFYREAVVDDQDKVRLRANALVARIRRANPGGPKIILFENRAELALHNPQVTGPLMADHPNLGGYHDRINNETIIVLNPQGKGNTVEHVERVIIHEVVGHGGMRALFGKKWDNFINKVIDTNMKAVVASYNETPRTYGQSIKPLTAGEATAYRNNKKALGYDWVVVETQDGKLIKMTRKDAQMLINEHIARQSERFVTDPQLLEDLSPGAKHWFHRVMAYVRHLLRPYVKSKVSDEDILSLLAESYDRNVGGVDRSAYMEEVGTQKANEAGDLMSEQHKYESDDIWKDRWEKDSKRQLREDDEWDGIYASAAPQSANENNAAKSGVASTKGHNAVDVSVVTDDMRAAESQMEWLNKARQGADRMLRGLRNVPYIGKLMHNKLMPGASKFEMLNRVHKGRVDANARRATQLHKMLAKLPADQLKKISDAWTSGEAFSALGLNPPQVALLTQGRKDLEDIQQMLNTMTYKGHKILTDEQLEETGGKFLHTEYMAYLASYRGSGKTPSGFDWMKRRTATKATEAQLEKISNASYTIPSTLGLVGRDTHLLRFMEDVAENAKNPEGPAWVVDSRATFKVGLAGGDQNMTINQIRHEMDRTAEALDQERMAHVGTNTEAKAILESNLAELNRVYSVNEEARLDNVANAMYQSGGKYARVSPSGNVQEKLVAELSRDEKEAFLEENFVWVTKKDYPNLLPFQGKYVHKEIINEFTQMDNSFEAEGVQKNGFAKAVGDATASGGLLDSTTRAWKLSKTGLNIPAYYMRNLVGNMFLLDISTSTNAASLTIDVGKEALATIKGNGKKYGDHTLKEWADKFGLYSTTYGASELYFLADDFERQMKKDVAKKNNQFMQMAGYEIKDSFMWLAENTANMHGLMEGIFKQVVMKDYIDRWEKGEAGKRSPRKFNDLSATEQMGLMAAATEEAGNAIFDYDKVPNWARTLRRTPFGTPFMTFNYKMAGALPRAMLKHPWKLARYYAAPGMASAALMATGMADFDDEEMEEIAKKVPWYMKNRSGFLIMPLKDANGKVQYFDLTYIFPPTLFTDAYLKMMSQEPGVNTAGALKDLVFSDLGLLGGPIPQALAAGMANKDLFTGRDIWVEGDLPENNWERTATWMWNLAMPPVLTEGGALGRSFNQAGIDLPMISSGQEFTKYGTDKETGAQTFWRGMGLSGGGFSPAEAVAGNEKRFKYKLNQVQKARSKAAVDPNKSRMERIKAVRAYEAQILELRKHRIGEMNG